MIKSDRYEYPLPKRCVHGHFEDCDECFPLPKEEVRMIPPDPSPATQMIHLRSDNIAVICRMDQSKTELGIKFWCYECRRYVLEDGAHKLQQLYPLEPMRKMNDYW